MQEALLEAAMRAKFIRIASEARSYMVTSGYVMRATCRSVLARDLKDFARMAASYNRPHGGLQQVYSELSSVEVNCA